MIDKGKQPPEDELTAGSGTGDYDAELDNLSNEFDDDISLDDDNLLDDDLLINDEIDSFSDEDYETGEYAEAGKGSGDTFLDFIKTYGFIIIAVMVFGYFGFKYSLGSLVNNKQVAETKTATTEQPVITPDKLTVPDLVTDDTPVETADLIGMDETEIKKDEDSIDKELSKQLDAVEQKASAIQNKEPQIADNSEAIRISEFNAQKNAALEKQNNELMQLNQDLTTKIDTLDKSIVAINAKAEKQVAADKASIEAIEKQLGDVNSQIKQITEYVQNAGKALGLLALQVKKQDSILATLGGISDSSNASLDGYSGKLRVDAVLSNRVWLKDSKGQSLSVKVGDIVPGSGKVVAIDPIKGSITTDQGKVIN